MENEIGQKQSKYQTKKKSERSEKKETYKYLGILEAGTIKYAEMKEKRILQENTKLLETSRNLIKVINTWAVTLVRYSGLFLKVDQRGTPRNEPENKKTHDNA